MLPRMGNPLVPRKCHFCAFFSASVAIAQREYLRTDDHVIMAVGPLFDTFCDIDPENRREVPPIIAMNDIPDNCPLLLEEEA